MSDYYYYEGPDNLSRIADNPIVTPQVVHLSMEDERVQDVVGRVERAIAQGFPDAEFISYIGTNPLGIYIEVYTEGDDFLGILRLLDDRLGNLHIAAGVDLCVVPRKKIRAQIAA